MSNILLDAHKEEDSMEKKVEEAEESNAGLDDSDDVISDEDVMDKDKVLNDNVTSNVLSG